LPYHAEAALERRLTAILAADVVGYSRLMGIDEAGTLKAFNRHRVELIEPAILEYGGRVVKLLGDGLLVEFGSVVNAVACAVEIQRGVALGNAEVPEDRRIRFRIGVNLGDVIVEGAISSATASMSPLVSRPSRTPAASPSPPRSATMSAPASTCALKIAAVRR